MNEFKYLKEQCHKVLCVCWTYNQSNYIEHTLNGFALQQTDFPFVCLILDDCSTDGEQDTIKAWMSKECDMGSAVFSDIPESYIVLVKSKNNTHCTFAFYLLKKNLYGDPRKDDIIISWANHCKYMAFCEGDDFWTAPSKLQEQYEALENHSECTIAFHRTRFVDPKGNNVDATLPWEGHLTDKEIYTLDDYMREEFYVNKWAFHTTSFFSEAKYYEECIDLRKSVFKNHPFGDQPLMLTALFKGKAYVIQKEMSCYRTGYESHFALLRADPQKYYIQNKNLVKAFHDLDVYTNKKYHRWIRKRSMLFELEIFAYEDRIQWYCFNPEYWTVGVKPGIRTFFKCCWRSIKKMLEKKTNKNENSKGS